MSQRDDRGIEKHNKQHIKQKAHMQQTTHELNVNSIKKKPITQLQKEHLTSNPENKNKNRNQRNHSPTIQFQNGTTKSERKRGKREN